MLEILGIITAQFPHFLLVMARVGAFMVTAPFFSSVQIPRMVKAGMIFFFSVLLVSMAPKVEVPFAFGAFTLHLFGEMAVGLLLGLVGATIVAAIDLAGEIIGMQIGFGIVNVIDPTSESQISIISQFKLIVFTLILLALNGHHWILKGLADSFEAVPVGAGNVTPIAGYYLFDLGVHLFVLGTKIAAPVVVVLLLTSGAMGIIARTIPQMNIFLIGFAIRIMVGIFILAVSLSFFGLITEEMIFEYIVPEMHRILKLLAGG